MTNEMKLATGALIKIGPEGSRVVIEVELNPGMITRIHLTPGELDALIGALIVAEDALAEASEVEA